VDGNALAVGDGQGGDLKIIDTRPISQRVFAGSETGAERLAAAPRDEVGRAADFFPRVGIGRVGPGYFTRTQFCDRPNIETPMNPRTSILSFPVICMNDA
jgi:hypothetical protein